MKFLKAKAALAAAIMMLPVLLTGAAYAENEAVPQTQAYADRYCIASNSKLFTTAAAMKLYDEGLLDIDAPVTDYVPEFTMADERYKEITVRMLMDHTSGLYGTTFENSMLLNDARKEYHDSFLQMLSTQSLKADPGEYGCYCNDGFTLLEIVIERVSGEDLSTYIGENICTPMGLNDTGTVWYNFDIDKHVDIFNSQGQGFVPEFTTEIGAGGIISTAEDLCRFGSAFFSGNGVLLSENAKAQMMKNYAADEYRDPYGLGWDYVESRDYSNAGVKLLSKGGSLVNQHSQLIVAPDEQVSVAVLSNTGNSVLDELLAKALMDIALEEKGITVSHNAPDIPELEAAVPRQYAAYEGIYADTNDLFSLTFPDMKYMELQLLTSDRREKTAYAYTADGDFIKTEDGVPVKDTERLTFTESGDEVYIFSDTRVNCDGLGAFEYSGSLYRRLSENVTADGSARAAWQDRSGSKYYFCSGCYSNLFYSTGSEWIMPVTVPECEGAVAFVNNSICRIDGPDSASPLTAIPSSNNRDMSHIRAFTENGRRYLEKTDQHMTYICEEDMPTLNSESLQIGLEKDRAAWYNIGGDIAGRAAVIERGENTSVYVYDRFDCVVYSNYITGMGDRVPLPEGGKIVFIGEGGTVGFSVK